MHRRGFLTGFVTSVTTGLACRSGATRSAARSRTDGTATADATESTRTDGTVPDSVGLETLATGFRIPLDVAVAPEGDRLYVAQQDGLAYVFESGDLRDVPFLDLTDDVVLGAETGLLGVALHPHFADNRRLFVRYSAPPRPGMPSNYSHTFVLSEFAVSADGRRVDRDSERTLLEIPEPGPHHNAGDLAFGPDGYLYVPTGDGGGGPDDRGQGVTDDWYDAVPGDNGQDVTANLHGSILRIDVDSESATTRDSESATTRNGSGRTAGDWEGHRSYAIPDDNPLVGREGLDEHYAWGFRNPWRMSFDGADLFVGDVGESAYEEVNVVRSGGNYGWNVKEGTHCYAAEECPDETPDAVRGGEPLVDPVVEYPHGRVDADAPVSGNAVVGGNVYRGSALPELRGRYVFADLDAGGLGRDVGGELFVATRSNDTGLWPTQVVETVSDYDDALGRIFAFGRDDRGELYVLGEGTDTGRLHRIVPANRV